MDDKFNSKDLVDKYSDMIYHIALGYLENKEDSEDIVQDVFIKYIDYIKSGRNFNDSQHEKSWIIRVTVNICCNEVNSARKRTNIPLENDLEIDFKDNSENRLGDAIRKLDDKYKAVFKLFYINDLKISEIGDTLHLTQSNVKTRLKRAREFIKDYITKGGKYSG